MAHATLEDDKVWGDLLGPAYSRERVADMLGMTVEEVDRSDRLLRLPQPTRGPGYPAFQFVDGKVVDGLVDVIDILSPAVATNWTIASWLTTSSIRLDDRRPIDLLAAGQPEPVLEVARVVAGHLTR